MILPKKQNHFGYINIIILIETNETVHGNWIKPNERMIEIIPFWIDGNKAKTNINVSQ